MTDEKADGRAERLKAALRENLRRRKAQVRGRIGSAEPNGDRTPREPAPGGPDSDKTRL